MDNKILKVEHLAKTYGAKTALKDVSFTVEKGKIYGFIGENGAGKPYCFSSSIRSGISSHSDVILY